MCTSSACPSTQFSSWNAYVALSDGVCASSYAYASQWYQLTVGCGTTVTIACASPGGNLVGDIVVTAIANVSCNYTMTLTIDCSTNPDEAGTLCVNPSAVSSTPSPTASASHTRTPSSTPSAAVTTTQTPSSAVTPTKSATPTPTIGSTQVCSVGPVDLAGYVGCPAGSVITTILFAK